VLIADPVGGGNGTDNRPAVDGHTATIAHLPQFEEQSVEYSLESRFSH
jgi:hypothetical protein